MCDKLDQVTTPRENPLTYHVVGVINLLENAKYIYCIEGSFCQLLFWLVDAAVLEI